MDGVGRMVVKVDGVGSRKDGVGGIKDDGHSGLCR